MVDDGRMRTMCVCVKGEWNRSEWDGYTCGMVKGKGTGEGTKEIFGGCRLRWEEKGEGFKENQTIRVADQIANDTALLFANKYLGIVPNDKAGREKLWSDIVKQREELQKIRAIQDFSDKNVTVTEGSSKKAVVVSETISVVNAMGQLYMTTSIE